jgi:hypothetical protein
LRTGDEPGVVSIERRRARCAESTISVRLGAVISCYDFHLLNGVDVGGDLHRITHRGGGRYRPLLEHVAPPQGSPAGGDPGASPGPGGATGLDTGAERADL